MDAIQYVKKRKLFFVVFFLLMFLLLHAKWEINCSEVKSSWE